MGPFASTQLRQPPSIETTFLYPIFWRLSADSGRRSGWLPNSYFTIMSLPRLREMPGCVTVKR